MALLSAPARRALEGANIKTIKQLAKQTKSSIRKLHGMGPASIPVLEKALKEAIPFPMSSTGRTSIMDAPASVSAEQLKELGLSVSTI